MLLSYKEAQIEALAFLVALANAEPKTVKAETEDQAPNSFHGSLLTPGWDLWSPRAFC